MSTTNSMNHWKAVQTLELNETEFTLRELKQQYRLNALRYHPDKNRAENASTKFQEIQSAYEFLLPFCSESDLDLEDTREEGESQEENKYHVILKYFMGSLQTIYPTKMNEVLQEIVEKMLSVCEKQSLQILEKTDDRKFRMVYTILNKYRHVFLLSPEFYQEMEILREKREKNDSLEIITLYPNIEDLMETMVYKLSKEGDIYYVPVWHQEVVFENRNTGTEFIVKCIPDVSALWQPTEEYIRNDIRVTSGNIDEENHIHIYISCNIAKIWEIAQKKENIQIRFTREKWMSFSPEQLHILAEGEQILRWRKQGISRISSNIYDISQKADLVLHVSLFS